MMVMRCADSHIDRTQEDIVMATKAQSSLIDELRAQFTRLLDSVASQTPFSATVVFNVKRAKESTFTTNADVLTDATTQLDGLKIFDYQKLKPSRRVQDRAPAVDYIIYEAWESCEFFRKQWDSKHLRHFQNTVLDLIVGPPELRFYFGSQPVTAGAPVMKTGQTQCWDSSGDSVNCKGTGQDGAIQSGMPFPEPSFGDNEDGTVTDTLT